MSRCAARADAEPSSPQRQRKPGNPANYVAFKAGNKLKRQRKSSNMRKTDAFPGSKGAQRQRKPGNPANYVAFKAGNKLKRQRKSSNMRKTDAFPGSKGAQRQRKPGNPANYVAFKAGNKLKRQRKSSNMRKTDAFPGPKGAQRQRTPKAPPPKPHKKEENNMRLDKYLKVSRLIKRRPVANEACDAGRILVNDKVAKASLNVKPGDVIEIQFGDKTTKVEVLRVEETYKKDEAKELYKYL